MGQGVHGVGGNVLDVFVELAAESLHEVADQERDVFGALAERGDLDGKNIQAVVEVTAEGALGDALRKIHVGGGDDADVHALRAIAAEPLEFLLLKHAKKFRLKFEGKVADFVEEERAAVGEFEAADFLADGAGERSALVAEELGFEKTARNCGAINFDEGATAARTEIMDGAGEELFAGAGFAEEKDGSAGGGSELHLGQGALERGALADDFLKIEFTANFFLEVELFFGELVLQGIDFLEGQSVFNGDSDLRGDLLQELDILRGEGIVPAAGRVESAKGLPVGDERNATDGLHACRAEGADDFVLEAVDFRAAREERLAIGNRPSGR